MKDRNQEEYQWAVVEFLEAPYPNINQYICIPHAWIRIRRLTDRMSIVSYPDESPLIIKKRIIKCENLSKKWKLCKAIVKYETNSYKAAKDYILSKKHDATTGNRQAVSLNTDHKIPSVPVKRIHPELKLKLSRKKLKIHDTISANTDKKLAIKNSKECGIPTDYTENSFSSINCNRNNNEHCNSLLNNYIRSYKKFQILPENIKETSIINPVTTFQGTKNKILYGTRAPLDLANQIRRSIQQQSSSIYENNSNLTHLQAVCPATTPQNLPPKYSDNETTYNSYENSDTEQVIVDEQTETICKQTALPEQTTQETSTIQSSANNTSDSDQLIGKSIEELPILGDKVSIEAPVTDVADKQSPSEMTGETVAHQKSSEQTNQTKSIAEIAEDWTDQIANIFKQMSIDLNHTCSVVLNMHNTLVHSAKVVEDIVSAAENARKLAKTNGEKLKVTAKIQNATAVKPADVKEKQARIQEKQPVIVEIEKPDEEMKKNESNSESIKSHNNNNNDDDDDGDDIEEIDDDDDDDDKDPDYKESVTNDKNETKDDTEDEDKETPKKIRGHIRSFVLPPEYDPNDTRWTLKYKKNDPKLGLVELVPKSKVYINSIRLAHCKRASKDSKTLGRLLLVEIFNKSALSVCSLTGARANAFDVNGDNVRPGLDEHARMTILSFVEDYTRQNNWGPFESQSVINSIRSKIQEVRSKNSQTV